MRGADEAYALGGDTPATTYLDVAKLLDVAARAGRRRGPPRLRLPRRERRLRPGRHRRRADLDRPAAVGHRLPRRQGQGPPHRAEARAPPWSPGTTDPVAGADEVVAFAQEHGLPVAIKAAFGGGGRGLKVARTLEEIPELFDSAVREAVAAFGRGECFVERYLDNPRHVETQCLADPHGNVVVVSTRDCSLQRRHQKLVEEAPAPFLTEAQEAELYRASKAILREAGYVGAGTCEFLVGTDGTISFLEVNTRLQVEHPVTEEVTGIDLVREMFRIADGEPLGYDDPAVRGHSFEFRINGEDPGRGFLPAPGAVTRLGRPVGPRRPRRLRRRGRRRRRRQLRLAARQAHRHRRDPRAGARALAPRARRVRGRRHGHGAAVPPRGRRRPGVRARRRRRRSRCTPAGSRPSSTTRSRPFAGAAAEAGRRPPRETVVVEVGGKRLEVTLPGGLAASGGGGAAAGRVGAEAQRPEEGRRRRVRATP